MSIRAQIEADLHLPAHDLRAVVYTVEEGDKCRVIVYGQTVVEESVKKKLQRSCPQMPEVIRRELDALRTVPNYEKSTVKPATNYGLKYGKVLFVLGEPNKAEQPEQQ